MKKILNQLLKPKKLLLLFAIFAISMIFIFIFFDYKYKKLKTIIILFYFFPGILLFVCSSIYNFKKYKNDNMQTKIIILLPLFAVVIYFLYLISMLIYIFSHSENYN